VLVVAVVQLTRPASPGDAPGIAKGQPAPAIAGMTLDGQPFDLASYRGRPVVVNFWGPSCIPCRDEFPLFKSKLEQYGAGGLAIVGVLAYDPVETAKTFIADMGATWPTVVDPDTAIRLAYRVVARPQTYFIDRDGVLREIQVGQVTADVFDRFYAEISGGTGAIPTLALRAA